MTLRLKGSTSGHTEVKAPASAGSNTLTLPTSNGSAEQFLKNSGTAGELEFSSMVETSTGVGIGTAAPNQRLTVGAGSGPEAIVIQSGSGNTGELRFTDTGSSGYQGAVIYNHPSGFMEFMVNSSSRLRIDSSGNVGIGGNGTGNGLGVFLRRSSPATTNFYEASDGTKTMITGVDSSNDFVKIGSLSNHPVGFVTNNTERARLDTSGRLLVGTTSQSDSALLTVEGNASSGTGGAGLALQRGEAATSMSSGDFIASINFNDNGGNTFSQISGRTDGSSGTNDYPGRIEFLTTADGDSSPTERMRIGQNGGTSTYTDSTNYFAVRNNGTSSTGNAFLVFKGATNVGDGTVAMAVRQDGDVENVNNSYGAYSDSKLKENIVDAGSQWNDLKTFQVRKYNFKAETGHSTHTQIGLIAQEVELVSPGLVSESPDQDGEGNDLGTTTKSVSYSVLYMKAIKALQEAMTRIETLEQRLSDAGIA